MPVRPVLDQPRIKIIIPRIKSIISPVNIPGTREWGLNLSKRLNQEPVVVQAEVEKHIALSRGECHLHIPAIAEPAKYPRDDFHEVAFLTLIRHSGLIPRHIKHIVMAHGVGTIGQDSWRLHTKPGQGPGESVIHYLNRAVPKGEPVYVIVCDTKKVARVSTGGKVFEGIKIIVSKGALENIDPPLVVVHDPTRYEIRKA